MSKKIIDLDIECQSCKGTGVYTGMGECEGAGVVCYQCDGTGKAHYHFEYNEFEGRKVDPKIKRVYVKGYGYVIAPKILNFEGIGTIDMTEADRDWETH